MKRIDSIRGNIDDPEFADRIERHERAETLEHVILDASERKKSRLRVETNAGTDLGILIDQSELHAGDVLLLEEDQAVVVAFQSREAFVIELPEPTNETLALVVELGHRIGNQHWEIAVDDGTLYVPVEADRHIIENVVSEYVPQGTATRYEEVDAELFFNEDSDDTPSHNHDQGGGHSHHEGSHDRSHSDNGHDHTHGDSHGHGHEASDHHSHTHE